MRGKKDLFLCSFHEVENEEGRKNLFLCSFYKVENEAIEKHWLVT